MWKTGAGILALTLSGLAEAEPLLPPAQQQEIIVQGNRNQDKALRQFIRRITVAERNFGQLGRFERPACPYVLGLGQPQDEMVASRIRQVAEAVGIETGNKRCKANVFVIVAEDKKATIKWMETHATSLLLDGDNKPVSVPDNDPRVAGWHVLGMKDDDGRESNFYVYGSASRIHPVARPHFLASALVIESRALGGLTTTELADYAAMRAFAQLDPKKLKQPLPAPTILTILDEPMGAAIPMTLTNWDLAFLRGLYSSSFNRYAAIQQSEIKRSMKKELAEHDQK